MADHKTAPSQLSMSRGRILYTVYIGPRSRLRRPGDVGVGSGNEASLAGRGLGIKISRKGRLISGQSAHGHTGSSTCWQ